MEIDKKCVCPNIKCDRHGNCDACRAFHSAKGDKPMCERTENPENSKQ
ncbi:MAG: hypothetical protein GX488_01030 [Clostridiales bacterium]|nr:hypothetical protein [Clostridiales bacterium]